MIQARHLRKAPWRKVQHIQTNERNGELKSWTLTLECGHKEKRNIRPWNFARFMASGGKVEFAPHKVRCTWCGMMERE